MRHIVSLMTVLVMAVSFAQEASANKKFLSIGTGSANGVYFPAGGAMCQFLNRKIKDHGIKCTVEMTGGSIYNLNAISTGELDVGAAQSDWQFHAFKGTGIFADQGPNTKLRSLFSLHSEPFTIVARADSGIKSFDDLKGKRINIGNPGSGMRATMDEVLRAKGWSRDSFKLVSELKAAEQTQALCDNKIDAMVYAAGHPNGAIQEVTTTCDALLIPVEGPEIDKLVSSYPYYTKAVIPGKMYKGNPLDTHTFGVKATFVTSSDVDEDKIYNLVKAVFDNFDYFKSLHFVFGSLKKEDLVSDGLTAPLHEGAAKYYKEVGLIK